MNPELEELITWAKTACEETRAAVGHGADEQDFIPSWLPELENAIIGLELAQS